METKTREDVSLQVIDSIDELFEETLKLSPFYVSLSESDISQISERALNPIEIKPISTRRPNISF